MASHTSPLSLTRDPAVMFPVANDIGHMGDCCICNNELRVEGRSQKKGILAHQRPSFCAKVQAQMVPSN